MPDERRNHIMIRIYLRLVIPLSIVFIALNIAARALGSTQPPNPALRGFTEGCDGKPQPCWYGIVPRVTKAEMARYILEQRGYAVMILKPYPSYNEYDYEATFIANPDCRIQFSTWSGDYGKMVRSVISIFHCPDLYWGDVLSEVNFPDSVIICSDTEPPTPYYLYLRGISVKMVDSPIHTFSPFNKVRYLNISENVIDAETLDEWRGQMLLWRYRTFDLNWYYPCSAEG